MVLTAINKLSRHIIYIDEYPEIFPYPGSIHEFLHVFVPGLPYPGNFLYPGKYPYRVIFLYPVQASTHNSNSYKKTNISSTI